MRAFWKNVWRQHFYPHIIDMDAGVSRISSLDFIRGLGILGMTLVHSLFNSVQLDYLLTFDRWYKYILAVFVGPILIFAPFRGVFAIISGTAYAFLTGQTMISRLEERKHFVAWYFIGIIKSILAFFILWLLAIVYLYSIELWQVRIPQQKPVIYEPSWKVATIYASPLSYFSISSLIDAIVFPPIFLLPLVIFSRRFPASKSFITVQTIDSGRAETKSGKSGPSKHCAPTTLSIMRLQPSAFNLDRVATSIPESTEPSFAETDPCTEHTTCPNSPPGELDARSSVDLPVSAAPDTSISGYSATGYIATALTSASVLFLSSYCVLLPTNFVVSALAKPLRLSPKEFCYLPNGYQVSDLKLQREYTKAYFLISFGANYYPIFPYYGATLLGFVLGLCLLAAYYNKKEYSQYSIASAKQHPRVAGTAIAGLAQSGSMALLVKDKDAPIAIAKPRDSKRYSDFPTGDPRFIRIIYIVMCSFAGIMFISGVIGLSVKGSMFRGIDGSLDLSGYCMPREEGMAVFGLSMFIIIFFIFIFEGGTVRTCCTNLQRASYILRFSTVSLTIFTCQVWIDLMGKFFLSRYFPEILRKEEQRIVVIILIIPMTILTYWVFTTISDSISNMWTLDWIISRIGGLIIGRYGKQRPLVDYHRRVRPMCLLAKPPKKEADFAEVPAFVPSSALPKS